VTKEGAWEQAIARRAAEAQIASFGVIFIMLADIKICTVQNYCICTGQKNENLTKYDTFLT
jgi:hypothetical protein